MFNNINLMNHQFMFNGRQDFEEKNSNLNIDIDLVGMGGGGGEIFSVSTFIEQ